MSKLLVHNSIMQTNNFIVIVICTVLGNHSLAVDAYKTGFTKAIYEQSWADETTTDAEKKDRLLSNKRLAIQAQLLDPLDELENLILHDFDRIYQKATLAMASSAASLIVFPNWLTTIYSAGQVIYSWHKIDSKKEEYSDQLCAIIKLKQSIIDGLSKGRLARCEQAYVVKKCKLTKQWQDEIEDHLLSCYETRMPSLILEDLVAFPTKISCLSKTGEIAAFRSNLANKKDRLIAMLCHDLHDDKNMMACEMALTTIAQVSFRALKGETTSRCALYFHDESGGNALILLKKIAHVLDRPAFIVDGAQGLNRQIIFGKKAQERGFALEPFLADTKGSNILNPLLVIDNFEHLVTDNNLPYLLLLLDPQAKSFHSDYFDLDIDWSAMSVLCCGKTPKSQFDKSVASRLKEYVIE